MSDKQDTAARAAMTPAERLASLSPAEKRRIGTAMRFLVDLKALHVEGLRIGSDLLTGDADPEDVAMRLMDLERDLRVAANEIVRRPLLVAHAEAFRTGRTKLDDEAWLTRARFRASQTREERREKARQERARASSPAAPPAETDAAAEAEEPAFAP